MCPFYLLSWALHRHKASDGDKIGALLEAIVKLQRTLECPMTLTEFGVIRLHLNQNLTSWQIEH